MRKLIKKGDPDVYSDFIDAVTAGTGGSNNERGLLQAVRTLQGSCLAAPWIRDNSTVSLLIVSDEDNCSDGTMCAGKPYQESSFLLDYLASIRQPGVNARAYDLLWHPDMSQAECSTGYNKANIYAEVIDATGGTFGAICDNDYSQSLTASRTADTPACRCLQL